MIKNSSVLLRKYKHEREILLDKIHSQFRNDPCITAAWLTGSLGRGDDDELRFLFIVRLNN